MNSENAPTGNDGLYILTMFARVHLVLHTILEYILKGNGEKEKANGNQRKKINWRCLCATCLPYIFHISHISCMADILWHPIQCKKKEWKK